jgi:DnaJ-class molecular chaperone
VIRNDVTQPGHVIKIEEEGMPKHQSSEKGDLYITVNIKFPKILTEKQLESKFYY